jgi:RND family efflux transporter MFP subunit
MDRLVPRRRRRLDGTLIIPTRTLETPMKNLKTKPIIIIALGALALAAMAYVMLAPKPAPTSGAGITGTARPALTVTSATPQSAQLPISLSANGNVMAWQEATIGSELNGLRLQQVRVNVGDKVSAGQVLAVFSSDAVRADLAQAQAALIEAQANATEASANAARARALDASGALSAQQISQYLTTAQTADARIVSAKAALASQQLRLKYTQLLAPDDGVISARTASVGAVVGSGTELFRMIRQGRLEWRAEVTASELGRISKGTVASVTAANGSVLSGRVRMIAPTVDVQTRSALVYVDLPASANARQAPQQKQQAPFKAGMFASGQFELGSSKAMTVAQQSVVVRDGFSYVFRLNPDQRVSQVRIVPGRRVGERMEVLEGITLDTIIVVAGAGFLNDGDLVKNVATPAAIAVTEPVAATGGASPVSATLVPSTVAVPLAR